ncbi:MAG: homocysteine S-methyltransferase family protein [Spirochaetaceae bacterium]|nr:homocysteine S-methyltransferase family protein [Spirochaetaceae bacterium]
MNNQISFRTWFSECRMAGLPVFFDGGMGTMLQAAADKRKGLYYKTPEELNIKHPDVIKEIHLAYLKAGANIITTNTFGATAIKMKRAEVSWDEAVREGVKIAREAVDEINDDVQHWVAFDMSSTGHLIEPFIQDISFDEVYKNYADAAIIAEKAGADIALVETMSSLYETKAAVLAIKENTSLPVIVSLTFQKGIEDKPIRMLSGADIQTAISYIEALSPDIIGWNCGSGLDEAEKISAAFCSFARLPVLVQPNAGAPQVEEKADGSSVVHYLVGPAEFAKAQLKHRQMGAAALGGCCGTRPEHIAEMVKQCNNDYSDNNSSPPLAGGAGGGVPRHTYITSGRASVEIGGSAGPVIIGERINPTNRQDLQDALTSGDLDMLQDDADEQIDAGAAILDINLGMPGIDEAKRMKQVISMLQETIKTPLSIDSADPAVLESALRYYNGKALINSVNGKEACLNAVLPIAAKYGGALVALTLDDKGIPQKAEERLAIADSIIEKAGRYGIVPQDILIDCLVLPLIDEANSPMEIIKALKLVKEKYGRLGVKTILGISNISFGMPNREALNASFLTLALDAGLDAAIINPLSKEVMAAFTNWKLLRKTLIK